MAVSCYDEGICLPTEEAQLQSLRVQQVIAHESGVADTVDPLGGSYCIEYLTDKLEEEATSYIEKIESLGGAAAAIEQGYQQREIQIASYQYQKEIEEEKRVIVGINKFVSPSPKIARLTIDRGVEPKQIESLNDIRKNRDNARAEQSLKDLEEVVRGDGNTIPVLLECVEAYATLGEMCDVIRKVFGTQRELVSV
jgi:methylmalonyl-CoA mutase N-terminal domain/subunit